MTSYFSRRGRFHFDPFYTDQPEQKRRRLGALGDLALAVGQPEVAGFIEEANDILNPEGGQTGTPPPTPSVVPLRIGFSGRKMARSRRFRFRRRFRRRRRSFAAKVRSVIRRDSETHRFVENLAQANFACGDGVTKTLYISNPLSQIGQGSEGHDFQGDELWIKAFSLRGKIATDETTNTLKVQLMLISTHQFADLASGWNTYGNTTTISTNPAQTASDLESNIRLFEATDAAEAAQPSIPFVGDALIGSMIDSGNIRVHYARWFTLGTQNAGSFIPIKIYKPIRSKWKRLGDFGFGPTDQLRAINNRNYYWVLRVHANTAANNILATLTITGSFDFVTYWKDV